MATKEGDVGQIFNAIKMFLQNAGVGALEGVGATAPVRPNIDLPTDISRPWEGAQQVTLPDPQQIQPWTQTLAMLGGMLATPGPGGEENAGNQFTKLLAKLESGEIKATEYIAELDKLFPFSVAPATTAEEASKAFVPYTPIGKTAQGAKESLPVQARVLSSETKARLARAKALGFDTNEVLYHGTRRPFQDFKHPFEHSGDFGIHTGTPSQAAERIGAPLADKELTLKDVEYYLGSQDNPPYGFSRSGSAIYPLYGKKGLVAYLPDMGDWTSPGAVLDKLTNGAFYELSDLKDVNKLAIDWDSIEKTLARHKEKIDRPFIRDLFRTAKENLIKVPGYIRNQTDADSFKRVFDSVLDRHGYDSVAYPNFVEGRGELSHMFRQPQQLRSVFAQFDPARANENDLLASLALLFGGGTAGAYIAGKDKKKPESQTGEENAVR